MNLEQKISQVLEEEILVEREDWFLVSVSIKGKAGNTKVQVEVDGDEGIQIDEIASVSRKLGSYLEEQEVFSEKYTLEVASPGLDNPLRSFRQYKKNVGRDLKVYQKDGTQLVGQLKELDEDKVVIEITENKKKQMKEIAFVDMEKSNIVVSFK